MAATQYSLLKDVYEAVNRLEGKVDTRLNTLESKLEIRMTSLEIRVSALERFRAKLVGMAAVVGAIVGIITEYIAKRLLDQR